MAEIFFNPPPPQSSLESQLENFQTTLASLNQQVIILQETLQERDQEIADLKTRLSEYAAASQTWSGKAKIDDTLTIVGALIKLYKLIFPPQSNVAGKSDFPPGKESTVPHLE